MILDEMDEVDDVHNEEYASQHRALGYSAQQTIDGRSHTATMDALGPARQVRPKPAVGSSRDAKCCVEALKKNAMVDCVERRRQIK